MQVEVAQPSAENDVVVKVSAGSTESFAEAASRSWLERTVKLDRELGRGAFGIVHFGRLVRGEGQAVAVKIAEPTSEIRREANLLALISHSHIIQLHASYEDATRFFLVLELCRGPELQTLLDCRGAFLESECRVLFAQLADALCYLRGLSIIHRDIKPANLMLLHEVPDLYDSPLTSAHLKVFGHPLPLLSQDVLPTAQPHTHTPTHSHAHAHPHPPPTHPPPQPHTPTLPPSLPRPTHAAPRFRILQVPRRLQRLAA